MANKDIIVIGASAGGIETLKVLVGKLPPDFRASIFVVLHTAAYSPGILPQILERAGRLPASNATDFARIERGRIYVAPPDHHMLLERANGEGGGRARVTRGPKENRFRPAIDPLFRSAAHAFGSRVIGVILTGYLDDGTAGLRDVKRQGGTAIVQDPMDALVPSMPQSALNRVAVDYCLPVEEIAAQLVRLADSPAEEEGAYKVSEELEIEVKIAREDNAADAGVTKLGDPSIFTCPECHGVLLQLKDKDILRFRCHTGHAFTVDSLLAEVTESIEKSLWSTIRNIDEGAMLMQHMAQHMGAHNHGETAELFMAKSEEAHVRGMLVRRAVFNHEKLSEDKVSDETETVSTIKN